MNSQMTDFARAGKCPGRGAIGLRARPPASAAAGDTNSPCWSSKAASASRPAPEPARRRKSRRETERDEGVANRWGSDLIAAILGVARKGGLTAENAEDA